MTGTSARSADRTAVILQAAGGGHHVAVSAMAGQGVTRKVFPVGQLAGLAAVATAASLVAAALPARRASRLRLLDAVAGD